MLRKLVFIIIAIAVVVFIGTLVHALWYAPEQEVSDSATLATSTPAVLAATSNDYPSLLQIPKLSVDAKVQKVGIAKSGNMGVPSNFTDVAWYKYGALPGQEGSAVIDGHVDNGLALDGVFKHLNTLAVGDDVYVQTVGGSMLHFVVTEVQLYPYQEVPMHEVTSTTGPPRLALISCDGAWVQGKRTYDHRLVVYAKLVV